MSLIDNITTISSAFLFLITIIIPTCPRLYPHLLNLLLSSLLYKTLYFYDSKESIILEIITKIDQLCIMNVFLAYYGAMQYWKTLSIQILTFMHYKLMYLWFGYFIVCFLYEFIHTKCYFLAIIFTLSSCIGLFAYNDYSNNGWNKYNSWLWHYSAMCIILCIKLCENNL